MSNCVVTWAFFGIAFLWVGMKTDLSQSCGHCWVFQICWHIECKTFTASSFKIWNSSAGIPSPPLALFVLMLLKAHLTSHSRMPGSRWVSWTVKKAECRRIDAFELWFWSALDFFGAFLPFMNKAAVNNSVCIFLRGCTPDPLVRERLRGETSRCKIDES